LYGPVALAVFSGEGRGGGGCCSGGPLDEWERMVVEGLAVSLRQEWWMWQWGGGRVRHGFDLA